MRSMLFGTDPYGPPVGATSLDNAPLVVEGGEVFPALMIPGPLSHMKPGSSRAAGQTHMYRPFMTCQSFTIATVERQTGLLYSKLVHSARTKILGDDDGIAVVNHAWRQSEAIGVDKTAFDWEVGLESNPVESQVASPHINTSCAHVKN